jgi:hypothetical protein
LNEEGVADDGYDESSPAGLASLLSIREEVTITLGKETIAISGGLKVEYQIDLHQYITHGNITTAHSTTLKRSDFPVPQ